MSFDEWHESTETTYSIHCTEEAVRRKNDADRTEIKQGTRNGVQGREGNYSIVSVGKPARILLAVRSEAWVCGRCLAGIVRSNRAGGINVCSECWCLSGSGLFHGPIPSLEESTKCLCVSLMVIICNSNPTYNEEVADAKIRPLPPPLKKNPGSKRSSKFHLYFNLLQSKFIFQKISILRRSKAVIK
jgi:hypothetical protein